MFKFILLQTNWFKIFTDTLKPLAEVSNAFSKAAWKQHCFLKTSLEKGKDFLKDLRKAVLSFHAALEQLVNIIENKIGKTANILMQSAGG
jgi:hypothetical protein